MVANVSDKRVVVFIDPKAELKSRYASPARTMGTPPALNALDQMRRMQISASGAGECAAKSSLETTNNSFAASREMIGATIAGRLAMFCGVELVFASGNAGGPVRLSD